MKKYSGAVFLICYFIAVNSSFAEGNSVKLKSLVNEALQNHPQIKEVQGIAKAEANIPSRVGSLPDPMLQVTAQNYRTDDLRSDSSPMSALAIGLVQNIPFPGKLSRRSRVAKNSARTAAEKEELVKALVIYNVETAYWNLHFAEEVYSITQKNIKIIDVLAGVAINRVRVAKVAQQDAFQAQVAHSKLRAKLTEKRESLQNAKRKLNRAVGRDPEKSVGQTESLLSSEPNTNSVTTAEDKEIRKNSPYLKVVNSKVLQKSSALSEAKYDRFPDLMLGLNYKIRDAVPGDNTNGADMVSVMFGVTLPIWMGSKQNARVSENTNRLMAAKAQARDVNLRVATQLGVLREKVLRLNSEIKLYEKEVLPRAEKALNASITDYKSAKVGFVSVVSNWSTEFDLQIHFEKLLKERAVARSEIGLVTGENLRRLSL
jgi:outer membrane protein TolC